MSLPPIGFGCSPYREGERRVALAAAVRAALAAGYRLFDCAELYGNEREIGEALHAPGAPARRELVIVGKAWRTSYRPDHLRTACEGSLARLGIEAFDLYLLHAPGAWRHLGALADPDGIGWEEFRRRAMPRHAGGGPWADEVSLAETWGAMEELRRGGLAAAIGVSNFGREDLAALPAPLPACDQIAGNPPGLDRATVAWCRERRVALLGHSPLSAAGLLADPRVAAVATALGRTPAQVLLRWGIQTGLVPLPSSTRPERIVENLGALAFELDRESMSALDALRPENPPAQEPP
ncbi:MAG TPA: aldo/keto reductase [Thermoanaerobaculia bacterium]|nr:aldo/keto reductase [Thermoanaerobaculia bacterium]